MGNRWEPCGRPRQGGTGATKVPIKTPLFFWRSSLCTFRSVSSRRVEGVFWTGRAESAAEPRTHPLKRVVSDLGTGLGGE